MLKPVWKYFFSKGNLLIFLLVIPSCLIPFIVSPSSLFDIVMNMELHSESYTHFFPELFGVLPIGVARTGNLYWLIGLLGLVLEVFFTSMFFGAIDRHMRTGQFDLSIKRFNVRINYNLLTALRYVLAKTVIFFVFQILNLLFFMLWASIANTKSLFYILCVVTFSLFSFICFVTYAVIILWPPFMLHTGLTSVNAFRMSFAQIKGSILKIATVLCMISLPLHVVMLLNSIFNWSIVLSGICDGLFVILFSNFYIIIMYTMFYEVTGLERMDLQTKKKNIWKIKKGV